MRFASERAFFVFFSQSARGRPAIRIERLPRPRLIGAGRSSSILKGAPDGNNAAQQENGNLHAMILFNKSFY
jgi:hypothetical protein